MNKDTAKDYLPLVQALAEGKTIQFLNSNAQWEDCEATTFHQHASCYRIKPEPKKQWYRVCLTTHGAMAASSDKQEKLIGNFPIFIRWLTDRIEYTLPEGDV